MIISVTGTPGTGKTTVAKYIVENTDYEYIDGNDFLEKACTGYDEDRECKVIDSEIWCNEVWEYIEKQGIVNGVIDSHLSHDISVEVVDLCIVTTCDRTELMKRLRDRGYSDAKIQENLEAEIMEVCLIEAQEAGHKVYKVDTTGESWKEKILKQLMGEE